MWSRPVHISIGLAVSKAIVDLRQLNAIVQGLVVSAIRVFRQRVEVFEFLGDECRDGHSVASEGGVCVTLGDLVLGFGAQVLEVILQWG